MIPERKFECFNSLNVLMEFTEHHHTLIQFISSKHDKI